MQQGREPVDSQPCEAMYSRGRRRRRAEEIGVGCEAVWRYLRARRGSHREGHPLITITRRLCNPRLGGAAEI